MKREIIDIDIFAYKLIQRLDIDLNREQESILKKNLAELYCNGVLLGREQQKLLSIK